MLALSLTCICRLLKLRFEDQSAVDSGGEEGGALFGDTGSPV